jgi:hypothetical protein
VNRQRLVELPVKEHPVADRVDDLRLPGPVVIVDVLQGKRSWRLPTWEVCAWRTR